MSHDKVAMRVVTFLGTAGIIGLCGVIYLVRQATGYEKIDPSTVALVAGVSTIVGALFGSLGSILASTGKGTQQPPPTPVEVVNTPAEPIPTTPAVLSDSEFGHADPIAVALVLLFAIVLLIALGVLPS